MTVRRASDDTRLVWSIRAAARRLGIGRGPLSQLIRDGVLRAVPWGRGLRIPEAELQRLAREGWTTGPRPRPPRGAKRRVGVADPSALLRARVEDL